MKMSETKKEELMSHSVSLQDRKHLVLTGVLDVERFDENSVVMYTELGKLCIKGSELNVTRLEITELEGEVTVDGNIDALEYEKGRTLKRKESFISKLLG